MFAGILDRCGGKVDADAGMPKFGEAAGVKAGAAAQVKDMGGPAA